MTSTYTRSTPRVTPSPAPRSLASRWPVWGWALIGVIGVWGCIITVSTGSPLDPLMQALTLAPYLVLVALGQMLVISLGPGNIDVSVAAIVSMSSYVSVAVGATSGPVVGLLAAVAAGAAAAAISTLAILALRVPPIIATLATSLIVASAALILANANQGSAAPSLRAFVNLKLLGVPVSALLVAAITLVVAVALKRTTYGASLLSIGQSVRAAHKAGIRVSATIGATYVISGAGAGLAGGLLAAFISPSTVLGNSYLLDSIAVVVVGGTLVAGGRPAPFGVWTGAVFFVLLSGLLNLIGWSLGAQNILKGILVVAVVIIAGAATKTGTSSFQRFRASLAPQPQTTIPKE